MVNEQLGARLATRLQHALCALEPLLASSNRAQPEQRDRPCGERGDDDRVLVPAVRLGDPHRILTALEPRRDRQSGQRAGDRQVTRGSDLEPRPSCPAGQLQRLLEVRRASSTRGPQLGDPEILERDSPARLIERCARSPAEPPAPHPGAGSPRAPCRGHRASARPPASAPPVQLESAAAAPREPRRPGAARALHTRCSPPARPVKRRTAAKTSASSASAAATSSGNAPSRSRTVAMRPSRARSK